MKLSNHKADRGTTLIELLIYIGIVSILLGGVAAVSTSALDAKTKSRAVGAVFFSSTDIIDSITQMTEGALAILTPEIGSASSSLMLLRRDRTGTDQISALGARLVLLSASSSPVFLSPPSVGVSDLLFTAVGDTGSTTAVRVSFTLTAGGDGIWQSFRFSESFSTMVAIGLNR